MRTVPDHVHRAGQPKGNRGHEGSWLRLDHAYLEGAGPHERQGDGLIKLAAAGVKVLEGRSEGVKSHSGRAAELFRRVMHTTDDLMGFQVSELLAVAEEIQEKS